MKKITKIFGFGAVLVLILALATTLVMAQETDDARPETQEDALQDDEPGTVNRGFGRFGGRTLSGHGRMNLPGGSMLDPLADELGMTVDEILAELEQGISIADLAESQGVDVETLIDTVVEQFRGQITEQFNRAWPTRSMGLDPVAEALGMTSGDLTAALSEGKSIADLAEEQGVDVQTLIDVWLAEHEENLNQAVEDGRITIEQAEDMLQQMAERIENMINETGIMHGQGRMMPGRGGRGHWDGMSSQGPARFSQPMQQGLSL